MQTRKQKIRVGIIGCCRMAKAHASRFSPALYEVDVTAAADIIPEPAQSVAESRALKAFA